MKGVEHVCVVYRSREQKFYQIRSSCIAPFKFICVYVHVHVIYRRCVQPVRHILFLGLGLGLDLSGSKPLQCISQSILAIYDTGVLRDCRVGQSYVIRIAGWLWRDWCSCISSFGNLFRCLVEQRSITCTVYRERRTVEMNL